MITKNFMYRRRFRKYFVGRYDELKRMFFFCFRFLNAKQTKAHYKRFLTRVFTTKTLFSDAVFYALQSLSHYYGWLYVQEDFDVVYKQNRKSDIGRPFHIPGHVPSMHLSLCTLHRNGNTQNADDRRCPSQFLVPAALTDLKREEDKGDIYRNAFNPWNVTKI